MAEAGYDDVLCESLPNATLSDITVVAWNWLWGEGVFTPRQSAGATDPGFAPRKLVAKHSAALQCRHAKKT